MRVWLAAFVLLFAAVELFEWFAQLGSWQPTGMWLILGGMGLAALSNATYLPQDKATPPNSEQPTIKPVNAQKPDDSPQKVTDAYPPAAQVAAAQGIPVNPQVRDESDKDSISFKVRPLKR